MKFPIERECFKMISIIIPVYNVASYLEEFFISLMNQTFSNFELIIIDDGSTDSSLQIIKKYAHHFKEFILIEQSNKGVSIARNIGLQRASKDYVIFLDPDDYLNKNYLKRMLEISLKTDSDIVICNYKEFSDILEVNQNDNNSSPRIIKKSGEYCCNQMLKMNIEGYLWNKMFKRIQLIKNNFTFESGRYIQDWFPVFKQLYYSNNVSFTDEVLYYYRQRESSTLHRKEFKKLQDSEHAVKLIVNFAYRNNLPHTLINRFVVHNLWNLEREKNKMFFDNNRKLKSVNFLEKELKNISKLKILISKEIPLNIKFKYICLLTNIVPLIPTKGIKPR